MRNFFRFFLLSLFLVLFDQATKYFFYTKNLGGFFNFLRPVFGFQIFPNQNIAFSIHISALLMWVMYMGLLLVLTWWFVKLKNKTFSACFAFALIISGALSNIFDRLAMGYVRDYIFVFWGNVFNFADLFILAGILTLLIKDNKERKAEEQF